jgi:hypothetical protein
MLKLILETMNNAFPIDSHGIMGIFANDLILKKKSPILVRQYPVPPHLLAVQISDQIAPGSPQPGNMARCSHSKVA